MELLLFVVALSLATGVAGIRLSFRAHRRIAAVQRVHDGELGGARRRLVDLETALAEADAARLRAVEDAFQGRRRHADLIRVVSRQMRTPLEGVLGFSDLIRVNAGGEPLSHRQRQAAERIGEAATRLLTLVEGMSALAEAERPATAPPQSVDPLLVAHRVCQSLAAEAAAAQVILEPPEPQAGLTVAADSERLQRVFVDVIALAVGRCPAGGAVTFDARRLGGDVQVTVRDSGPDLTAAQLEALFQPLDAPAIAAVREEGGRALWPGLAAAQRLLQAMQGRLEATNVEGRGVAFIISLPAAGAAGAVTRDTARLLPELQRLPHGVVLYVARDPAAVALMRRLVQDFAGLQLHVAACATNGLTLARDLRPDVVVFDLDLADDRGAAFVAELRSDPAMQRIPVLGVSSDTDIDSVEGVAELLQRPVSVKALAEALKRALGRPALARAAS